MRAMKRIKEVIIGLVWAFVFFLARNLSFQFDDIIVVLDSLILGVLVHKLKNKLWTWMVFIALALPLTDLITLYVNSIIPFILGYFTGLKNQNWSFYLWYLVIPVTMVLAWGYRSESHSIRLDSNANHQLELYPLLNSNGGKYEFSPDTTYLLSYWHLGCGSCIRQDRSLRILEYRHKGEAFKVISVYLGDTTDRRFKPTVELYHQHFPNFYDRSAFLQKQLGQDYGPALLLYKDGRPQRIWHAFTTDTWKTWLIQFYWDWYIN